VQQTGSGGALIDIIFELGQSKQLIERRVYGLFDWMNEVGGFFGFMQLLFQIVIPFCQIWSLEKFLIQKLYREHDDTAASLKSSDLQASVIDQALYSLKHRRKIRPLKELPPIAMINSLASCLCKTLSDRKSRIQSFERAQEALSRELDILHFVKLGRLVHNACRLLLSQKERKLIKMQADRAIVHEWNDTDDESETYPDLL